MDNTTTRFTKIAYLYLTEGRPPSAILSILHERGADDSEAQEALTEARRHFQEFKSFRNRKLFQTIAVGVVIICSGLLLFQFVPDTPNRFGAIPLMILALGVTVIGYAIWSRSQPR